MSHKICAPSVTSTTTYSDPKPGANLPPEPGPSQKPASPIKDKPKKVFEDKGSNIKSLDSILFSLDKYKQEMVCNQWGYGRGLLFYIWFQCL